MRRLGSKGNSLKTCIERTLDFSMKFSTKAAVALIVLGFIGLYHTMSASVGNSLKAYALQDHDSSSLNGLLFCGSFLLLLGGVLMFAVDKWREIQRRKKDE